MHTTFFYRLIHRLIGIVLLAHTQVVLAQGELSGRITDKAGAPVGFATVAVVQATERNVVTGNVADADGQFHIKTPTGGTYKLRVTALGYMPLLTPAFTVTDASFSKAFGQIMLTAEAKQLREVNVEALRPTITQEADRMVVNLNGTALVAGQTAYQILSKLPGVFIDPEGNIQLNGRSGVTVMLDGKLTYLSAGDLRTMLEGMTAENIKNVEIITNPSAKYDAEGSSGILNINLKKNTQRGMNGSVFAGYTFNGKQHGYNSGGTVNYKNGPWNSFASLEFARRVGGREATFTRVFVGERQTTYFNQVATGNFVAQGPPAIRLGTDYSLSKRHSIGLMAFYFTRRTQTDFLNDTYIGTDSGRPAQRIDSDNLTESRFSNVKTNLHYQGKLDTAGTTLTADLDFAQIQSPSRSDFFNYFDSLNTASPRRTDFLFTDAQNTYTIYAAKTDYTRPFARGRKLEMGAKMSRVTTDNDFRFYLKNSELPVLDPRRTNHFYYREGIYAAYVNGNTRIGKYYLVQAGLRAEHTESDGRLLTMGQVTKRSYLSLFPSLFVQRRLNASHDMNFSYSRRIQRPNYGNLNPFVLYRDPYTWWQGNPFLRPQFTHSFSLTHRIKKTYSLIVNYQLIRDAITELPLLNAENATTIYTVGNVNDARNVSLTGIVPIKLSKRWESSNTLVLAYNQFSTPVGGELITNNRVFYMLQSNQTLVLPFNWRAELNGTYRGPTAAGLYQVASQWWLHVGLRKSLLNKKVDLSLNATDIFKGQRLKTATAFGNNVNEFNQYFRTRTISLSLRYKFSRGLKVDERRRQDSSDEADRADN